MPTTLGVVGIGTMGMLVVQLLLDNHKQIVVSDTNVDALQQAKTLGAVPANSPSQLAEQSDIVLMLLPGPAQVEAVVNGDEGLLAGHRKGQILVDMSTVDPNTTRRMGELAEAQGIDYLDAPILGRPSAVGRWVLPVGGDIEVLERARPILNLLAREIHHVGSLGAGHALKLLNALMFSAINAMTAEMMAISTQVGLDPAVLFNTIAGSDAATVSGLFKESGRKIVERDFDPVFTIDLLCKDNGLAIQMAKDADAPPLLATTIQTLNELGRATGHGAEDTSALVKVYETLFNS